MRVLRKKFGLATARKWRCINAHGCAHNTDGHGGNVMYTRWLLSCIVICAVTTSRLEAQESNSWWPFGGSDKTETRSSSYFGSSKSKSKTSSSWMKWPSWSSKSKSKSNTRSPSVVSRAGQTSKRWWSNTVDFMNPFNDSKPAQSHGYESDYWSTRNKPKEDSSSGMFGWMWKEEKQEVASVNDFLALPIPQY